MEASLQKLKGVEEAIVTLVGEEDQDQKMFAHILPTNKLIEIDGKYDFKLAQHGNRELKKGERTCIDLVKPSQKTLETGRRGCLEILRPTPIGNNRPAEPVRRRTTCG